MKTLFLGLGKVNLAIARQIDGEKIAFVENGDQLVISRSTGLESKFEEIETITATFDYFNWKKYLPAQVFISPGIDPRRPFFKDVIASEAREIDFFCSRFKGKTIAITGTDGKSTFTTQLGEVLKRALPKLKIFVGGNLGTAMADALSEPYDIAVLEISSFQAERLKAAKFELVVILNLDTDHLDRYDSITDYHNAKWGLLRFAAKAAYPVPLAPSFPTSRSVITYNNRENLSQILLELTHYLSEKLKFDFQNTLLKSLPRLPHRLERKQDLEGRTFVNDSKATTVHAVMYGLRTFQKEFSRVQLILGGKFKGDDFSRLATVARALDRILIYGEAAESIRKQLKNSKLDMISFPSLEELLKSILPTIKTGDCLLLSPGCSSYDEFKNYEERGEYFWSEIRKLYSI
ncbi:MAG: UDP-N-acetylmuramoyl-L-alanine--D-glutamate ligase [Bacteriovoracaceae bacterium]|nr:UDP-N-acetylmuramoyl-L-alanine--D-glutamate ligase [Bacteriovoracaceae bacterium]